MNSLPNLLILEGGIAAGKTSLLHNLANEYNLYALEEPVTDNPYLAKFYEDPKKWSFEFQMWFLEQRIQHYKHACQIAIEQPNNIVILDRSVFSDSVFARLAFQDGFISQNQFDQYLIKYNDIVSKIPLPTAVVYLDVSPETCLYRIKIQENVITR
uniref:Deoxyguanosine kinase n=1 Tax=Spironucleus salmonicida TaxID=348837 RepID=V6LTK8_9EUKA|eukprot:EST47919.1 Deoxyguanosine kinase [Spironucleus salmonicida]